MADKRRTGRFTLKEDRELIAMAASGAAASEIAAKLRTSAETIKGKARALGIHLRAEG
jgi:DNA-binding CsgD family transcriptional regulator